MTVVLSFLIYFVIWDSPSEIGLNEFNQTTLKEFRTENKTGKSTKEQVIALLLSPFLWVLSIGYLMTLFVKTGVGEWTQLFLIQTVGRSQYDSEYVTMFKMDSAQHSRNKCKHFLLKNYS